MAWLWCGGLALAGACEGGAGWDGLEMVQRSSGPLVNDSSVVGCCGLEGQGNSMASSQPMMLIPGAPDPGPHVWCREKVMGHTLATWCPLADDGRLKDTE